MTPQEYVQNAINTESSDFPTIATRLSEPKTIRLLHGTAGMVTELGEIYSAFEKPEFDSVNFKEELGDIAWYLAIICSAKEVNLTTYQDSALYVARLNYKINHLRTLREVAIEYTNHLLIDATELLDMLKKHIFYGKEIADDKFHARLGNLILNIQYICVGCGYDLVQIQERNIEKLKARYPQKFTSADAVNRDLKKEREILEK